LAATMKFSGQRSATFDCSFMHPVRQWVEFVGSKAVMRIEDFVIASEKDQSFTVEKQNFGDRAVFVPKEQVMKETVSGCIPHQELIVNFSKIVLSGKVEEFWPEVSLKTQQVLNALMVSARKDGEWVVPKVPAAKGKGKGKGKSVEAQKREAKFGKVSKIVNPQAKGLNLKLKVVSVKPADEAGRIEAVLGDDSGVVTFAVFGEDQQKLVNEGASLVVRNGYIKMIKGFLRLNVDKWGKLETSDEAFTFDPKTSKDMSAVEYERVAV